MEGDSPGPGQLASQLAALGVERGGILVVHASFRSVGPVDGGPGALIDHCCRNFRLMGEWLGRRGLERRAAG